MTPKEITSHLNEVQGQIDRADEYPFQDEAAAYAIGALIIAVDQLAEVVKALAEEIQE